MRAARRDFLRDAVFRWMTCTFAALSSAEVRRRYAAEASAAFFVSRSVKNFLSSVWRRDLTVLLWAWRRRLARACLAAERVRGIGEIPWLLNGASRSEEHTSELQSRFG